MNPLQPNWIKNSDGTIRYSRLSVPIQNQLQLEVSGLSRPIPLPISGEYDVWAASAAVLLPVFASIAYFWLRRVRAARKLEDERREYHQQKQRYLESLRESELSSSDWSGATLASRFKVESLVARGGFASVYRAKDMTTNSQVAVKILHPIRGETQWRRRRYAAEIAAVSRLQHPGIVRLEGHGDASPDQPFLATEWIEGQTSAKL